MRYILWAMIIIIVFLLLKHYGIIDYLVYIGYVVIYLLAKLLLISMVYVTLYVVYSTFNDN